MTKTIFLILFLMMVIGVYGSDRPGLSLGTEQGDGGLYIPFQVEEGPHGNFYVFDAKDAFIKIYDPSGKFINKMGGRGQGPGEIVRLGYFEFLNPKTLFFTEDIRGHHWITLMDLSGKFKEVWKLGLPNKVGLLSAKPLWQDRIVAETNAYSLPKKVKNYYSIDLERGLVLIEKEKKEKVIIDRSDTFSICSEPNGAFKRVPFFPEFFGSCSLPVPFVLTFVTFLCSYFVHTLFNEGEGYIRLVMLVCNRI